jgi:pimeloyl-ACP methyl ester carboxylesterase
MPTLRTDEVELYYEIHGAGYPVLLIAPGGMRSAIPLWERAPWDPVRELAKDYQVIAMDQRNAGRSRGPVTASDGWQTYADDQLALLDHLGVDRFHVGGMCIGGAFAMKLAAVAPARVTSAVLFQPIGFANNREAFYEMYQAWADDLGKSRTDVAAGAWDVFKHALYDHDFLFAVDRDTVARCEVPVLVLRGNDLYHPEPVSREVVRLAPHAQLIEHWKEPEAQPAAKAAVAKFLAAHTPA